MYWEDLLIETLHGAFRHVKGWKPDSRFCWVINNGHGAKQAGKRSPSYHKPSAGSVVESQFFEWIFNLTVATFLVKKLVEQNIDFYWVSPFPTFMGSDIQKRVSRANNHPSDKPKIYLSIHANAATADSSGWQTKASGFEVWYYSLSIRSKELASVFSWAMNKHLTQGHGFKDRGLKRTPTDGRVITELIDTNDPAITIEFPFYNNPVDLKFLDKDENQVFLAETVLWEAIQKIETDGLINY